MARKRALPKYVYLDGNGTTYNTYAMLPLPNGLEKRKDKAGFASPAEAVLWREKAVREATARGGFVPESGITLTEFFDKWLAHRVAGGEIRATTAGTYRKRFRVYIKPFLGEVRLPSITRTVIRNYVEWLAAQRLQAKGRAPIPLAASTRHDALALVNALLAAAANEDAIARNPAQGITIQIPRAEVTQPVILSKAQMQVALDATRDTTIGGIILLAMTFGLRISEIIAIRWEHIDFAARTLTVIENAPRDPERTTKVIVGPTKGNNIRVLRLSATHLDMLDAQRVRNDEQRARDLRIHGIWNEQGLVFPGECGAYRTDEAIRDIWYRVTAKAGLPRVRIHDLRHTAISHLANDHRHDLADVQYMAGHESLATTLKYINRQNKQAAMLADTFGGLIWGDRSEEENSDVAVAAG